MHSCLKCSQGIPGLVAAWPPALCKHCNGLWCLTGASQTVHAPSCCVFLSVVLCCACVPQPPALVYMRKHLRSWFADCTASSPCSFAEQRDAMPAFSQLHPSQLQPAIETSTAALPFSPVARCLHPTRVFHRRPGCSGLRCCAQRILGPQGEVVGCLVGILTGSLDYHGCWTSHVTHAANFS